jgi:3-oxoacyl-[acyl-carrier-protein] synthase II
MVGVMVGSGIGGLGTMIEGTTTLLQRGPDRVSPFTVPMFLPDMLAGIISMHYGAKGPNLGAISACATSGHTLGESMEIIKRGDADVMIAGGAEATITRLGLAAFDSMRALSRGNDNPQAASRPFDLERDGFVMGEGGGVVVLELLEHAQARGAHIYGELIGYGLTGDAHHMTAPSEGGEGAVRSMRMALRKAGMQPSDIDYINAHGTSTPANDKAETQALKTTFDGKVPPVSSTKSMTGHMIGAGGAVEAIFCLKAIAEGCLPPTINQTTPDPECDLDYIPNVARKQQINTALSNSFGFGGHNTTLILRRVAE